MGLLVLLISAEAIWECSCVNPENKNKKNIYIILNIKYVE